MDNQDRIFIEKGEGVRLIAEQGIGDKIFEYLGKKYKVNISKDKFSGERIIFIEKKNAEEE